MANRTLTNSVSRVYGFLVVVLGVCCWSPLAATAQEPLESIPLGNRKTELSKPDADWEKQASSGDLESIPLGSRRLDQAKQKPAESTRPTYELIPPGDSLPPAKDNPPAKDKKPSEAEAEQPSRRTTEPPSDARQQFHAYGSAPYSPVLDHAYQVSGLPNQSLGTVPAANETERQHFWDQFATTPPDGDLKSRTEGYGSFGAIIANGYAYGRIEFAVMEAHFQNNGGLNITSGPQTTNEPWDFGFEFTPRYVFGFETNAGPGIEITHWQFNEFSDGLDFQSDATSTGEISVFAGGTNGTRSISANLPGQLLQSRHHLKIQSTTASFFKAFKAPVSRIRGMLGMRYVATQQDLFANRNDGAALFSNSNFQGGGPTIGIDYFRPVGHTQINLLGGFGFSLLFGHHDQTIFESGTISFRETATDRQLAIFDMHLGAEWQRKIARCTSLLVRTTFESQHWINGGSATDANSDFGIYGFVFSIGITR